MTNSFTQALINQCARLAQYQRILMKVSLTASLLATLSVFSAGVFSAAPVLADKPLGQTAGTVKPNLMFVLDTSKSTQSHVANDALGTALNDGSFVPNAGQCKAATKNRSGTLITGLSRAGTTLTVTAAGHGLAAGNIIYLAVPGNTPFSGVYTVLTTNAVAAVGPTCSTTNASVIVNLPYKFNEFAYNPGGPGDPTTDPVTPPTPASNGCAVIGATPANSGSTVSNFNLGGGRVVNASGVTAIGSGSCYWYDPLDNAIGTVCNWTGGSAGSPANNLTVAVANSDTSGAFSTGAGSQTEDARVLLRQDDTTCVSNEPPLVAAKVQTLFYNPSVEYVPPPKPTLVGLGLVPPANRLPSMTRAYTGGGVLGWTRVPHDGTKLQASGEPVLPAVLAAALRRDFTVWTEMVYCDTPDRPTGFATDKLWHESSRCKRNTLLSNPVASSPNYPYPYPATTRGGATNPSTTFFYNANVLHQYGVAMGSKNPVADLYAFGENYLFANPFYYNVRPIEYCDAANLKNCILASTPTGAFTYPAYVRYCRNNLWAAYAVASPGIGQCQGAYTGTAATDFRFARYGLFERVDVKPAVTSYAKSTDRLDCLGATCSYDEEMTNFANWYSYYRTRMQLMKSTSGRAFDTLNQDYRVGLITVEGYNTAGNYLPIKDFITGTNFQKENWFKSLYSRVPSGGTSLRDVLGTVGKIYAGNKPITGFAAVADDPMQYSCQKNYTLLTTDGYWNGPVGQKIDGSAIGNQDATPTPRPQREGPVAPNTLADVAQYYYETDIRSAANANCTGALGTDVCLNDVVATADDPKTSQHMTTSTIGLGVDGQLNATDYKTAVTGDFVGLNSGAVLWPVPAADNGDTTFTPAERATIDDLWHAAVNGRGTYYNATNPQQLITGIAATLATLGDVIGSGSATSLSNNTPVTGDNYAYSARYVTGTWTGNLFARTIAGDGTLSTGAVWCVENETSVVPACVPDATTGLRTKVGTTTDSRTIYANVAGSLQPFKYASLTAAQKVFFDAPAISGLSQYAAYNAYQLGQLGGAGLVDYLRGQKSYDRRPTNNLSVTVDNRLYRERPTVLGDIVDSDPVYVGKSRAGYADAGYTAFLATTVTRDKMVYVGANDGMLHAFNATTGEERWAYVPTKVMPNMWKLADADYRNKHTNFVNAKMTVADVYVGGAWKTILVSGFGQGGRGYFALDISNPSLPSLLWETDDAAAWDNLGYSYGKPVIVKRAIDDKWVVLITSGYNNTTPGDGKGRLFVLDAGSGAALVAGGIATTEGTVAAPSGLAQVSAFVISPNINSVAQFVYGGDLLGNLWRFNLNTDTVLKFTTLEAASVAQPITVAPTLGEIDTRRVIFIGTGKYIEPDDLLPASFMQQTLYGIKDNEVTATITGLRATLVEQTLTAAGATRTSSNNPVDWSSKNGWFVDLNSSASTGERQNVRAILASGALIVPTMIPPAGECGVGTGWLNVFNYRTGGAVDPSVSTVVSTRTTSPIAGMYIVYDISATDGRLFVRPDFTNTAEPPCPLCNIFPLTDAGFSGNRSIWRELIVP